MKRSKPKTRWLLVSILIAASALTYFGYRYFLQPPTAQPADIFMIASELEYGDTTISGLIQKDTTLNKEGKYYLVLEDGHVIELLSSGLDSMVNRQVTAYGYLTPKIDEFSLPLFKIDSMETSD